MTQQGLIYWIRYNSQRTLEQLMYVVCALPTDKCEGYCTENGVCDSQSGEPVCNCRTGWSGDRCQTEGIQPLITLSSLINYCKT